MSVEKLKKDHTDTEFSGNSKGMSAMNRQVKSLPMVSTSLRYPLCLGLLLSLSIKSQ